MSNYKELFLNLLKVEGEEKVYNIINKNSQLKNQNNWVPYGETRKNFSVFDNQQPNAVSALIEKITNSIDSILIKECHFNEIDPKDYKKAPKSMSEAVEKFFNIKNGELGEITPTERKKLAKDIQLIATGTEKTPDILIFDNGEGQHPNEFKNTFLSLRKGNKNNIHFVQGQFNMGSTGAVVFCGEHRYQLIASRKNQQIFDKKNNYSSNIFGFTLVRRHILNEEENKQYKTSWYEYFVVDGQIPSFKADELDIGLCDDIKFNTGSIIKLFSYILPRGCGGTIRDGLYHELNQSLYKPALPFLLRDKRQKYISNQVDILTVSGNDIRLSDDRHIIEKDFYTESNDKTIGSVKIKAILIKKGEDQKKQENRKRRFIGKKSVIFTINGQVHGFYGKSKIKEWGFTYLKDSLLIHIDCTNIKINLRQDLFMADRYNFKETEKLDRLIEKIKQELKSTKLKEANDKRKEQLLQGTDDKSEIDMIKGVLSKNPATKELENLLKNHGNLLKKESQKSKPKEKSKREQKPISSKRFPSIFKVNLSEKNGKKVKSIPIGGRGIIEFETDVQNDYFQRPNDQGELILEILGYNSNSSQYPNPQSSPNKVEDCFNTTITGPDDHSIKITLEPTQNLNIGDSVQINAKLSSPEGDLESIFYVKISKQGITKPQKVKDSRNFNPPKLIKISKKDNRWIKNDGKEWSEEDWRDDSIIHILTSENKVDAIAVNMDSHILKKYISKKSKGQKDLEVMKNHYITQIYSHGLFLFNAIEKNKKSSDKDSAELVSNIFKTYGQALLYLNLTEELLKIIEQ